MKTVKPDLTVLEKSQLKKAGIKISTLSHYAVDELGQLLHVPIQRAKQSAAAIQFQSIPSVGPKFARDLIDMGYYTIAQLKDKDGAQLIKDHEQLIGHNTDPCVEDQFRLVVYYANHPNSTKQWWDFTAERKAYRAKQ